MKAYTNINQSKKLAKILPLESADGFWEYHPKWCSEGDEWEGYEDYPRAEPYLEYTRMENEWKEDKSDIPCWSLAALLDILPMIKKGKDIASPFIAKTPDNEYYIVYATLTKEVYSSSIYDNPVDACVEMIENLHELKML